MLEVVSTSKEDELSSLRAAAAAGVDSGARRHTRCRWCGASSRGDPLLSVFRRVVDHPSVLLGTMEEIAAPIRPLSDPALTFWASPPSG